MKKLTCALWTLTLAALLAGPAFAQDEKPADSAKPAVKKPAGAQPAAKKPGEQRQRGAGRQGQAAVNRFFQLPAAIELTDAQQEQVAVLKKEFAPKVRELQQKQNRLLTDDQKQARRKVQQEARESGKKGKELQEAVAAALALTDDQKRQQEELRAEEKALRSQIEPKLHAVLTDAQKAQLPKRGKGAAARKSDSAKPKNAAKPKDATQPKPKAAGSGN